MNQILSDTIYVWLSPTILLLIFYFVYHQARDFLQHFALIKDFCSKRQQPTLRVWQFATFGYHDHELWPKCSPVLWKYAILIWCAGNSSLGSFNVDFYNILSTEGELERVRKRRKTRPLIARSSYSHGQHLTSINRFVCVNTKAVNKVEFKIPI